MNFCKIIIILLLLPAVSVSALGGNPGHIRVDLQLESGNWVNLGEPSFDLDQSMARLRFPADLAGEQNQITLRLAQPDNDETQIDFLSIKADQRVLEPVTIINVSDGSDLTQKLAAADRDVVECNRQQIMAVWQRPAGVSQIELELQARSSRNSNLRHLPFQVDQKNGQDCAGKPYRLKLQNGSRIDFNTGILATGSGHPAAPLMGWFKVEGDHLKARLDFGPDNDPGSNDYASIVAQGEKGEKKEFKITMQDHTWGKPSWVYGQAADWQYMVFEFDIPLTELPRRSDQYAELSLLTYGTSCVNVDYYPYNLLLPDTMEEGVAKGVSIYAQPSCPGGSPLVYDYLVTGRLLVQDAAGNLVFDQRQTQTVSNNSNNADFVFTFIPGCSGTHVFSALVWGENDTVLDDGRSAVKDVSGSTVCLTPTPVAAGTDRQLYPNPVSPGQDLCVTLQSGEMVKSMRLFTLDASLVSRVDMPQTCLKVRDIAPGVYLVQVSVSRLEGEEIEIFKVIVR